MRLLLILCTLVLAIVPAKAGVYDLNGKRADVVVDGKQVLITQRTLISNRETLFKLFEGGVNERSGQIEGTAYVYVGRCNRTYGYWVIGDFRGGDEQLVLSGALPSIDARTCSIVGRGPQHEMVFNAFHY